MLEFNPDGSLKLPDYLTRAKEEKSNKLKKEKCILIRKEVLSSKPPKKCLLHITLSDVIIDNSLVKIAYQRFMEKSEVHSTLTKINEKEFKVELGTCFRRCNDCKYLVSRIKELISGNIIEEKGNCAFEDSKSSNFCYEDYFN